MTVDVTYYFKISSARLSTATL